MRFKTIWVQGVQKVKEPIRIDLDTSYTSIRGPSDTGKSAIFTKAILLFTGKYDIYDLETLCNYDSESATVVIELEDDKEGEENKLIRADVIGSNVTYTMYKGQELLKVWQGFSPEIPKEIGLITTKDICVNVMESSKRLFIDTNEEEHTELLEELFSNEIFDKKLRDIGYYLQELTERQKFVSDKFNKFNNSIRPSREAEINKLTESLKVLDELNETEKVIELIKLRVARRRKLLILEKLSRTQSAMLNIVSLQNKKNILTGRNKLKTLNEALVITERMIKMDEMKTKVQLSKEIISKSIILKDQYSRLEKINKVITLDRGFKEIEVLQTALESKRKIIGNPIKDLNSIASIVQLRIILDGKKNITKRLDVNSRVSSQLKSAENRMGNINILRELFTKQMVIHNKQQAIDKLNKLSFLTLSSHKASLLKNKKEVENQLSSFEVCPLCHSEIK